MFARSGFVVWAVLADGVEEDGDVLGHGLEAEVAHVARRERVVGAERRGRPDVDDLDAFARARLGRDVVEEFHARLGHGALLGGLHLESFCVARTARGEEVRGEDGGGLDPDDAL